MQDPQHAPQTSVCRPGRWQENWARHLGAADRGLTSGHNVPTQIINTLERVRMVEARGRPDSRESQVKMRDDPRIRELERSFRLRGRIQISENGNPIEIQSLGLVE